MCWRYILPLLLLLSGPSISAQDQQANQQIPVLRTETRLVVVDLIVTDRKGRPVTDLNPGEVTLTEKSVPERLSVFQLERAQGGTKSQTADPLSVTQTLPTQGALTILLIDTLNTDDINQMRVRDRLLAYTARQHLSDQPTAVLALGNHLRLLQDFTTNPKLLDAALRSFSTQESVLVSRERSLDDPGFYNSLAQSMPPGLFQRLMGDLQEIRQEELSQALDVRIRTTLAALQAIGRATARYPVRKNLIWVSSSIPFSFSPENLGGRQPPRGMQTLRTYDAVVRETAALLSNARVAVYPVDARGLAASTGAGADFDWPPRLMSSHGPEDVNLFASQSAMIELAEQTGGKAFINHNDIDRAVELAAMDAGVFYTVAYYPQNKKWNGEYRKITIKVTRPGVKLRYRRGYYAVQSPQPSQHADSPPKTP